MKTATLFILCLAFLSSFAQEVNYDQVIPTDSAVGLTFEEKLIRLAWNNHPQNKVWHGRLWALCGFFCAPSLWLENRFCSSNIFPVNTGHFESIAS